MSLVMLGNTILAIFNGFGSSSGLQISGSTALTIGFSAEFCSTSDWTLGDTGLDILDGCEVGILFVLSIGLGVVLFTASSSQSEKLGASHTRVYLISGSTGLVLVTGLTNDVRRFILSSINTFRPVLDGTTAGAMTFFGAALTSVLTSSTISTTSFLTSVSGLGVGGRESSEAEISDGQPESSETD